MTSLYGFGPVLGKLGTNGEGDAIGGGVVVGLGTVCASPREVVTKSRANKLVMGVFMRFGLMDKNPI